MDPCPGSTGHPTGTAGIVSPLLDACRSLYGETAGLGFAGADMTAVLKALEARSERLSPAADGADGRQAAG